MIRSPLVLGGLGLVGMTLTVALAGAESPAPDLEIVALQTTGPGRIGDCNAVVARLHNAGSAATAEPPAVRLEVTGATAPWTRTERASGVLAPGATVEVWFESVPLPAGLSRLVATSDPDHRVSESVEDNNTRQVPRDPQLACGAAAPAAAPTVELRVVVVARRAGAGDAPRPSQPSGASSGAPIENAAIEVTSPLGVGTVLAAASTAPDGRAVLALPSDPRHPVLRVTASAPGCSPATSLAMLSGSATATSPPGSPRPAQPAPIDLTIELDCARGGGDAVARTPGRLEIESALPGRLQIDDEPAVEVTFGSRLVVERPGGSVRLRASSLGGAGWYDQTLEIPRDAARRVVVDAPVLRSAERNTGVVEDLRSGLEWTVGAASTDGQAAAASLCESLERGGATDWRLPSIDELAFVLEARALVAANPAAPSVSVPAGVSVDPPSWRGLSQCCLWSSTEHAGGRLTYYLDGGHIYGRRAGEGGVGALCVRGTQHAVDPLAVPERYHDRLPGSRRFRPRD